MLDTLYGLVTFSGHTVSVEQNDIHRSLIQTVPLRHVVVR
jgi:hypothetical protein